jgi:hypothetical protein
MAPAPVCTGTGPTPHVTLGHESRPVRRRSRSGAIIDCGQPPYEDRAEEDENHAPTHAVLIGSQTTKLKIVARDEIAPRHARICVRKTRKSQAHPGR